MKAVLLDDDLARLRTLLGRTAGLVFEDSRRDSLAYCVGERLRAIGVTEVGDYLALVEQSGSRELQPLVDEVTIQETHFFRNPPQARALRAHVLPELVREADTRGRRIRIWSAGCSTGDEPYSIAMDLRELLPRSGGWDVKVIATDVSQTALAAARTATYGPRALQLATPEQLSRSFVPLGDGRHVVRDEVRELVEFRHHNLVRETAVADGLDLVLCRNVTIYFSRETTRALVQRLHTSLRDGGYLFLGHSETLWRVSEDFRLVTLGSGNDAAFVYRRLDRPAERRAVLPDRRTLQEHPVSVPDRRGTARRFRVRPGTVHARRDAPPRDDPTLDAVRDALGDGRYGDAARLARLVADADPLQPLAHYLLGRALVELGQDDQALPALRRAVYLDPAAGLAHFLLAGALARTGDATAAAREYRAAAATLGRDPDEAGAHELGGRSARELAVLCAQLEGQLMRGTA